MKLLHDWSNFDLPKLMPVEHIFLMPSSCLSLTLIHARIHANKLLITAQPIRNLRTPASAEMNKRGFLWQASLPLSPLPPSLFPFFPFSLSPTPFDACYAGNPACGLTAVRLARIIHGKLMAPNQGHEIVSCKIHADNEKRFMDFS